jgi:DNA-binding NarL/FixJ family response regulator
MGKTVLIVDDHAGFRASARRVLESEGFSVVGEAGDGEAGIAAAGELGPEVVLLDVQLPDIDGFAVARQLTAGSNGPVVVLTSTRDSAEFGSEVSECGARGFVPKGALSGKTLGALLL